MRLTAGGKQGQSGAGASVSASILIIDDDRSVRDMLALYLKTQGHQVRTAPDGEQGVAACREDLPQIVMCDLRMPGMDGHAVVEALHADFPELPVMMVSGTGDLSDAVAALKLGAWDYITKPILDLEVLDHAIGRLLERATLLAENRGYREQLEETNARLKTTLRQLEEDETAARRIQFTLLPPGTARFGEFECSHVLVTSAILSGDFVDYFAIDARRFAFYIADVSGHGVASAVVTVLLKSEITRLLDNHRLYEDPTLLDPASLLARLNRSVLEARHGKHLTLFYGIVDLEGGKLRYANGGHYPYPLLTDGTETSTVGERSVPIGLFEDSEYVNHECALPRSCALRLFSDGVLELLPGDDLAQRQEHLRDVARALEADAAVLASAIGVDTAAAPPDDASVLSIRRIPAND
jgi:serine phosphatase RsbU (regulator of sigma subunit)